MRGLWKVYASCPPFREEILAEFKAAGDLDLMNSLSAQEILSISMHSSSLNVWIAEEC